MKSAKPGLGRKAWQAAALPTLSIGAMAAAWGFFYAVGQMLLRLEESAR